MLHTIKTRCLNQDDTLICRLTILFDLLEDIAENIFDYLDDTDTPFIDPDLIPDLKKTGLLEDREYEEEELQKALHDLNADALKLLYTFARIALDDMIGKDKYKLQFNCLLNDPYAYNKGLYDASVAYIDSDGQLTLHAQPIEFHLYKDWLCASGFDKTAAQAAAAK